MIATFGTINTLENSLYAFYEKTRFSDVFGNVRRAPDSLIEDIQKIPGISIAETRIHGWSTLDLPDMAEPVNAQLISLPESGKPLLNGLEITEGTYPNDERFDEVIISDSFAKSHNLKTYISILDEEDIAGFVSKNVLKNEKAVEDHFVLRRPGLGINPQCIDRVLGKRYNREINEGELLDLKDIC